MECGENARRHAPAKISCMGEKVVYNWIMGTHAERAARVEKRVDEKWEREHSADLELLRKINQMSEEQRAKWHRVCFGFTPSREEDQPPVEIKEYWTSDIFPDAE